MNIFCLLTLLCFTNVVSRSSYLYMKKNMSDKFSFLYKFTHLYKPHPIIKNDNHYLNILQEKNPQHIFLSKIKSYLRLIRYKNIIPTLGLSYTGAL
jgi:hypothetical protein